MNERESRDTGESTLPNPENRETQVGGPLLALVDRLVRRRDSDSLEMLAAVTTSLILRNVIDESISLIELNEYCNIAAEAIRQGVSSVEISQFDSRRSLEVANEADE